MILQSFLCLNLIAICIQSNFGKVKSMENLQLTTFITPPAVMLENDTKTLFGSDLMILTEISKSLNLKLRVNLVSDRSKAVGDLADGRADIIAGTFFHSENYSKYLHVSDPYDSCEFVFITPPGSKVTSIQKLFMAFDNSIWILTILIFLLAFFATYSINAQSPAIRTFIFERNGTLTFMNIFGGIFATSSVPFTSKRYSMRLLWIIFLLFGVIMRSLHQATLFKFLQDDSTESGIRSLDEAFQRNFTLFVHHHFQEIIINKWKG
jgi:Bacterial extracellular solute-binding proteins, family 3